MITENYEAKIKNNAIRMEIIDLIMDIFDTKSLQCIKSFANSFRNREFRNHPMTITAIAFMTDTKDIKRIMKALEESEPGQIAVDQMKEAFGAILLSCSGNSDTKKKESEESKGEIMKYQMVNEELNIASCSISDLTMEQVTCILNQFEDDAPIDTLTLFYDKNADIVVLNKDNENFNIYLDLAEAFLKSDRKKAQEFVDEIPSGCRETLEVLRDVKRARKIKEELRINGQQGTVGWKGTYLGCVFNEIIRKSGEFSHPMFLMSQAYTYGVIQGKREERARRKRGTVS